MMSHLPLDVQRALDSAKHVYPAAAPRAPLAAFPDRREVEGRRELEGRGAFDRAAAQLLDKRRVPAALQAAAGPAAARPPAAAPFSPALIAVLLVVFPPAGVFAVWTTDALPLQGKTAASVVSGLWVVLLAALFFAAL
jgi:hypothetical protein